MWITLVIDALKLLGVIIGFFSSKSATLREYERMVKSAVSSWEKRTAASGKLRKDHRAVDEQLEEKWKDKWREASADSDKKGSEGSTTPHQPQKVFLKVPPTITRNVSFAVEVVNAPVGSELYRDQFYLMTISGTAVHHLTFNKPGRGTLRIDHRGQVLASVEIEVSE